MIKKMINLILIFTVFTVMSSCYDNSNDDHTDVEAVGPMHTNDSSATKGNDLDTTGVNSSKVKK
jgi:hypothetical protein